MFGGLITKQAQVLIPAAINQKLVIELDVCSMTESTNIGDSIAINGVCLTVTEISESSSDVNKVNWSFVVSPETLSCTTLNEFFKGQIINVEACIMVNSRIGGHLLSGHVDSAIKVLSSVAEGDGLRIRFELPDSLRSLVAVKGSVAIDGVSLTVASIISLNTASPTKEAFEVALIPHTIKETNIKFLKPGMKVNLEIDMWARYAARYAFVNSSDNTEALAYE